MPRHLLRSLQVILTGAPSCLLPQVMMALCSEQELPLPALSSLPQVTSRVVRKLLAKDPLQRWTADRLLTSNFFQHMEVREVGL